MLRPLSCILVSLALCGGCASIRPSDEAARYMLRSAPLNKAPSDGTYVLLPGVKLPAVLSTDLKAGDPIGFRLVDTANGQQLYAVAGTDDSYLLDRAQRYTWTRVGDSTGASGAVSRVAIEEQIKITERARDDAKRQLDAALKNLEAAERRLSEVRARATSKP